MNNALHLDPYAAIRHIPISLLLALCACGGAAPEAPAELVEHAAVSPTDAGEEAATVAPPRAAAPEAAPEAPSEPAEASAPEAAAAIVPGCMVVDGRCVPWTPTYDPDPTWLCGNDANGDCVVLYTSTNLRRACARQKASRIAPP